MYILGKAILVNSPILNVFELFIVQYLYTALSAVCQVVNARGCEVKRNMFTDESHFSVRLHIIVIFPID